MERIRIVILLNFQAQNLFDPRYTLLAQPIKGQGPFSSILKHFGRSCSVGEPPAVQPPDSKVQKLLDPRHPFPALPSRDQSLPSPRAWTATAPWMSHQFCRPQTQKKSSVRQIDVSTGSNGDWAVSMEFKVRRRNI
ncbi:hypothetical protein B9Z55_011874 [Caenorhabditis nigoni]|uniref:Uncharacterized protein n=1 Tax=Caenorhabditis nigoni TaxID=1611254 RepID=A0A2G5ULY5_9PELO|nr:hypothetical protein B9Z55_011874 [Caenorhabditis nigoni]